MSRHVVKTMNAIFDALKESVFDDHRYLVADVTRHIHAAGDESSVCEFVKNAKFQIYQFGDDVVFMLMHNQQYYLLLLEDHTQAMIHLGLERMSNIEVVQGSGMLAQASGKWPVKKSISSLDIIDRCLGIDDPDSVFEYSDICDLFNSYGVWEIDNSRFELVFKEDIDRLISYILAYEDKTSSAQSKASTQALMLLKSSRSVAASVVNSYRSSLPEYTFLQWYQCIEYLFRINNSISISSLHNVPIDTAIDIVTDHELKISEEENLYQVLKSHASDTAIDYFLNRTALTLEETSDKVRCVAKYIYRHRCSIAHLRYNQDTSFKNSDWKGITEALVEVVYSLYIACDDSINTICTNKHVWTPLSTNESAVI